LNNKQINKFQQNTNFTFGFVLESQTKTTIEYIMQYSRIYKQYVSNDVESTEKLQACPQFWPLGIYNICDCTRSKLDVVNSLE